MRTNKVATLEKISYHIFGIDCRLQTQHTYTNNSNRIYVNTMCDY